MTKLTYLGHSCFFLEDEKHRIIFDPFLSGNPLARISPEEIKVEAILLSHGHGDHLGDAINIARSNNALIIAPFELAMFCQKKGASVHPMHIGGSRGFDFGKVKLTIAHHGSAFIDEDITYTGNPCGFVVNFGGKNIYHSGDTGLFMDMKLIGEMNKLDVALIPIGDNFTMGVEDAVKAVEFLNPGVVIPMHFDTFDVIKQDPLKFAEKLKNSKTRAQILKIGESYIL
ncbi:MAG: metal-dependent hydrolase [candidate division Zixibacteria bacterium]|nr:metal-dependent hydrolase [candidate division Zixibacteria bacterium]